MGDERLTVRTHHVTPGVFPALAGARASAQAGARRRSQPGPAASWPHLAVLTAFWIYVSRLSERAVRQQHARRVLLEA